MIAFNPLRGYLADGQQPKQNKNKNGWFVRAHPPKGESTEVVILTKQQYEELIDRSFG